MKDREDVREKMERKRVREIEKERDRKGKIGREKQIKNNEKREGEGGEIVRKRNRDRKGKIWKEKPTQKEQ